MTPNAQAAATGGSVSPAKGSGKPVYRKLPGRPSTLGFGAFGQSKLYLGDEHLLQVSTAGFVESDKHFAYADIQALLLRQTGRGLVLSVILGVLVLVLALISLSVRDAVGRGFLWGFGGFFALLLIVNLTRGTTCRCQLETAIGSQPLRSLSRVRPARKAFALIIERITAAQGALTPTDAAAQVDEMLTRPRPSVRMGPVYTGSPGAAMPPEKYNY